MQKEQLKDYTVIDFETCGISADMRKHVTEISAIRVRNGQVADDFSSLVNPKISIPELVSRKTKITNDMVANAPTLDVTLPKLLEFIGHDTLLGYNISTFDIYVLRDIANEYLNKTVTNTYLDVYLLVQEAFPNASLDRSLVNVCRAFGIKTDGAHRALQDCYMTKNLYDALSSYYDHDAVADNIAKADSKKHYSINYSDTTLQLRKLQDLLKEIVSDNEVTVEEVEQLSNWLQENIALKGNYPFDRVYFVLEKVLEDGVVDKEELSMLLDKFNDFLNPTESKSKGEVKLKFLDKHFVLTGDFDFGPRSAVEEYIKDRDGIIDGNVKKCTNYVIVGAGGSDAWANGNYGTKIKKALELKEKGQNIEIMTEAEFFAAGDGEQEEEISEDSWEQMSLFDNATPWQDVFATAIEQVLAEEELPEKSVILDANYSRTGEKVTSYSLFIRKPDYPKGINANGDIKTSLLNIQFGGYGTMHLLLPISAKSVILPEWNFEIKKRNSEDFLRVIVAPESPFLSELFLAVTKFCVSRYLRGGGDNSFGCCHLYKECSAAKKCLHENKLYARGCQYYYNLKAGRIFY